MIGNEIDAAAALDGVGYLDAGTTRSVYLINGVIYKIDDGDGIDNAAEFNNYLHFMARDDIPPMIAIPETHLYRINGRDVIAMEYIQGQPMADCWCLPGEGPYPECIPANMMPFINEFIDDTGGMNVILRDDIYYIIDMAC